MPAATPFSAVTLLADVSQAMIDGLDRRAEERGLRRAQIRLLQKLEVLRDVAQETAPCAFSLIAVGSGHALRRLCLDATAAAFRAAMPMSELLAIEAAAPIEWRHVEPTIEAMLWGGATRLADGLALICAVGVSTPERQEQLATARELQAALGRLLALSLQPDASANDLKRAIRRVTAEFNRAHDRIGTDMPVIQAQAAVIRARRQ